MNQKKPVVSHATSTGSTSHSTTNSYTGLLLPAVFDDIDGTPGSTYCQWPWAQLNSLAKGRERCQWPWAQLNSRAKGRERSPASAQKSTPATHPACSSPAAHAGSGPVAQPGV